MSRVISQHSEIAAAEGMPVGVGRGSGLTLREIDRRIRDWLKRKKMPLTSWKDRAPGQRRAPQRVQTRCRTQNPWNQL
jgi:hypothetical protein